MSALIDIIHKLNIDLTHRDADIIKLKAELAEARNDLTTTQARLSNALAELRCPDCKCADQVDAESNECGCDSPVCARVGGKTLAEAFVSANADADLLGHEVWKWEIAYGKVNRSPELNARPTAAARVKGGAS